MHEAVKAGEPDFIKILLNNKADPNIRDKFNQTPIFKLGAINFLSEEMIANNPPVEDDRLIDICKMLIRSGADLKIKDLEKKTPIDYAKRVRMNKIVTIMETQTTK